MKANVVLLCLVAHHISARLLNVHSGLPSACSPVCSTCAQCTWSAISMLTCLQYLSAALCDHAAHAVLVRLTQRLYWNLCRDLLTVCMQSKVAPVLQGHHCLPYVASCWYARCPFWSLQLQQSRYQCHVQSIPQTETQVCSLRLRLGTAAPITRRKKHHDGKGKSNGVDFSFFLAQVCVCAFRRRCGTYSASWGTAWPCESAGQQGSRLSSAPWASVSLLAPSLPVGVRLWYRDNCIALLGSTCQQQDQGLISRQSSPWLGFVLPLVLPSGNIDLQHVLTPA